MNPVIAINPNENSDYDLKSFNVSNLNVSFANAIRRTIMSDIPLLVFKTSPYAESKCTIFTNTTRLNNEILKQRLSCIPIHMSSTTINFDNYEEFYLEVNVENTSDTKIIITSADFNIRKKEDNSLMSKDLVNEIFPPSTITGDFIDFARLRPRVGENISGDHLHLVCDFIIGSARDDGMFNVVSNCAYGFDIDEEKQAKMLDIKMQEWADEGKSQNEIEYEGKNWMLLDGKRVTKPNSFNFTIQTVGSYTNTQVIKAACDVLNMNLDKLNQEFVNQSVEIVPSTTTMANCYDIILTNQDYTLGKIIEYAFLTKYYESKIATFCGFQKKHPHDDFSIIRIAYEDNYDVSVINGHIQECISNCKLVFEKIKNAFRSKEE
jgi:DNA-directed RNA polymerase subunit L|uniref:DNA-directed RNA polymerase RpoA/D/Rpb3-type domain-containing protein n=1 Tax=viral metagenome TaxID=1070528 RepID=A0A6C0IL54_9ZZZZ